MLNNLFIIVFYDIFVAEVKQIKKKFKGYEEVFVLFNDSYVDDDKCLTH